MTKYPHSSLSTYFAIFFSLLALLLISSCRKVEERSEILVSAAISLKEGLIECAKQFESEHAGTRVVFNFGASGLLAQQIAQGAPTDIFVSASDEQLISLQNKKLLVDGSIQKLAGNKLVLMAPLNRQFRSISELKGVEKLAIGNPKTVPAGAYAVKVLKSAGLYDLLESGHKLVLAEDARQVLAYVEAGNVDAGMVYNTDARLASRGKVCLVIPQNLSGEIIYEMARVRNGRNGQLAEQFASFLAGARARELFVKLGFST
jgi:molybdate transport system substrate-binding protein